MFRRLSFLMFFIILLLPIGLALGGCSQNSTELDSRSASEEEKVIDKSKAEKETITLTAAGDILMHNTLVWSGEQNDGSYNFDFFSEIKPLIEKGAYCTTNLESPLAGPRPGYNGYPLFNSPDALARDIKESGFDCVITANNHILDQGYIGTIRTLDVLRASGLDTLGANRNEAEASSLLVKDFRGVKVGYLAYTYGTNGIPIPKEHPYLVNILDKERILGDIIEARPQVDVLILILHWGVEYSPNPTEEQRIMAKEFLKAGVDAIIGSHPHVVQPMEIVNVEGRDKLIAYSLGNLLGDQRGLERNTGVFLNLKFTKETIPLDESTKVEVYLEEVTATPTYSHSYRQFGKQKFRVVPIKETIKKINENKELILTQEELPILEKALRDTQDTLGFTKFSKANTHKLFSCEY